MFMFNLDKNIFIKTNCYDVLYLISGRICHCNVTEERWCEVLFPVVRRWGEVGGRRLALLHRDLLAGGVDHLGAGLALLTRGGVLLGRALLLRPHQDTLALPAVHLLAGRPGDGDAGLLGLWRAGGLHSLQTDLLLSWSTALSCLAHTGPGGDDPGNIKTFLLFLVLADFLLLRMTLLHWDGLTLLLWYLLALIVVAAFLHINRLTLILVNLLADLFLFLPTDFVQIFYTLALCLYLYCCLTDILRYVLTDDLLGGSAELLRNTDTVLGCGLDADLPLLSGADSVLEVHTDLSATPLTYLGGV